MKNDVIRIKCEHCEKWMNSPIVLEGEEIFDTSKLIGNIVKCPHCGKLTGCNKENMKVDHWDDDTKTWGFRGNKTF